jgi:hypothetical protein
MRTTDVTPVPVVNGHDVTTAEGQLARARERGLTIVTETATGRQGWTVQNSQYGYAVRVRWAGAKAGETTSTVPVDSLDFEQR